MHRPRWLDLDGTANARDVGGLPVEGGGSVRTGRLLRSDNLQDLTARDVHALVEGLRLRTVIDLRTDVEVRAEGPGPLAGEAAVANHHLSLFPEPAAEESAVAEQSVEAPAVEARPVEVQTLPWQDEAGERAQVSASEMYLRFLAERPDSVVTSLRLIARSPGAALVHCAAGKDRTGVVVALALRAIGVPRDAVVADYVASADRIEAILARLMASTTYAKDRRLDDVDHHRPKATTIEKFLDDVDGRLGGPANWLRSQGWTDADDRALRRSLIDG